jgi:UDP-arabinose 4-epimerase
VSAARKVLVTGGAGYVGAHACKALAAAGFEPVTLDNLSRGHQWAVQWGPLEVGDIGDAARVDAVLDAHRPIAALHFAAYCYVGESVRAPRDYYRNNVVGTLTLLDALLAHGVRHLVFSSSCATYGIPDCMPIVEATRQAPVNPYGRTKLIVEGALNDYDAAYGLRFASLRYFNAAGADPDGDIGEAHEPETHAVPAAIHAALGRRAHFEIYGTDYPTEDGTAVRDYIHVADLADAHVLALERLLAGGESLAVNLGTGRGHSVRQVVTAVEAAVGGPVPINEAPRRAGDPPVLVADPSRAAELLRWRPRHPSLSAIVASAVAWHRRGAG